MFGLFYFFNNNRFHADKHSSAHYYLRLKDGETIDDIPEEVLSDICQMTKESSKDGRKLDDIRIIYTLASNLKSKNTFFLNFKETGDMETGEVGFHNRKNVKYYMVRTKNSDALKRLIKTREEREIDMNKELETYLSDQKRKLKMKEVEAKRLAKQEIEDRKKLKEMKDYSTLMKKENMKSNSFVEDEDDEEEDENAKLDSTFDDFM
jgi:hypothetical protein